MANGQSFKGGIAERIFAVAESEDVPVLGMGWCAPMEKAPPGYRPTDSLPGARSMVCFGLPVPRAVYDVELHPTETVWRAQNMYYKRLDMLSLRFAQLLEECGARALPAFGCYPMALNKRGEVAGYLNMLRMGECTGIGTLGRNGLLLNSRYGARLMLGGLITTAELPVTRNVTTPEPGCPAGCRVCIDACPVGAISEKKGRVRIMRCAGHAARTPFMPRLRFGLMTKLNPEAAARFINQRAFDEHTTHVCSRCVSRCPYGE